MKTLARVVALVAVLTAPVAVSLRASAPQLSAPVAACSAQRMIHDHEGVERGGSWAKVYRFGCDGPYAYAWALFAYHGRPLFDLTAVMKWSPARGRWMDENRGVVCVPGVLPDLIYQEGCFSN